MKRLDNLINEDTITNKFIYDTMRETLKGKTNRKAAENIMWYFSSKGRKLKEILLSGEFTPSPYATETRIEYGKERHLQKTRLFPDQCAHHALVKLVRENILKRIDPYAVASIPGRGIHYGLKYLEKWIQKENHCRSNAKYCWKGDIRKCFESLKPEVVYREISKIVKDKLWLSIFKKVIFSYESLPLGNYMSAYILNIILKPMDDRIRALPCTKHYLRYMDDFIILGSNKREMKQIRDVVVEELGKLGLELKPNYQLFKVDDRGVDMLGFRVFRHYTILRKRNLKHIYRLVNRMSTQKIYSLHACRALLSMYGQLKHCHSTKILKYINEKINMDMVHKVASENRDTTKIKVL